jgi:DNA protecting protein dprA
MEYTENALNVLTAKAYRGVEREWIVKNIRGGEGYKDIVDRLNTQPRNVKITYTDFLQRRDAYEKILIQRMKQHCDGMVARGDALFPTLRGNAFDKEIPVFIYYLGDISLLQETNQCAAVIGLRNPTEQIETRERAIVRQLVQEGVITVSGLAIGCDTIAHRETLKRGGKTVAILPSPLSQILPESNVQLADLIVENGGLVLSEYGNEPTTQTERIGRYIARDRLQALFSDAVILTASYARDSAERPQNAQIKEEKLDSGARFAMEAAKKYAIERAVMYDASLDATNAMFDLNRDIIKEAPSLIVISETNRDTALESLFKPKYSI